MNIISYKFLPRRIAKSVDSIIDRIQPGSCYKNAFFGSACDQRINYVLGTAYFPTSSTNMEFLPIEHAWNEFDGKYFDLTSEIIFKDLSNFFKFEEVERLSYEELFHYLKENKGCTPDLWHYHKYKLTQINMQV